MGPSTCESRAKMVVRPMGKACPRAGGGCPCHAEDNNPYAIADAHPAGVCSLRG